MEIKDIEAFLSQREIDFLVSRKTTNTQVILEAKWMSHNETKRNERPEIRVLIAEQPCLKCRSKLRLRDGRCLECHPKSLSFQDRFFEPGIIYLAYSQSQDLCKIGIAKDVKKRHKSINKQSYANARDWSLVFFCEIQNAGRVESDIHSSLAEKKIRVNYNVGTANRTTRETFRITVIDALKTIKNAITPTS